MKQFSLLLAVLMLCTNFMFAQKKNLTIATASLIDVKLKEAKNAIDIAAKDETTKDLSKTWKLRGDIYYAIHQNKLKFPKLDKNAVEKAYKSYKKAIELGNKEMADKAAQKGKKQKPYRSEKEIISKYDVLADGFRTDGLGKYQNKDTEGAVKSLKTCIEILEMPHINKVDTNTLYYIALMSSELGNKKDTLAHFKKDALTYFKKVADLNYGVDIDEKDEKTGTVTKSSKKAANIHFQMGRLSMELGDTAKAVEIYENSIKLFPKESSKSLRNLISYYLASGQSDQAIVYLNEALKKEPENAAYHTALGELYDIRATKIEGDEKKKQELYDEAIKHYKDAMKYDAKYSVAFFNTGVIYFNQGVTCNKKASELPFYSNKANPEYDKLIAKQLEYYKTAIPFFEDYLKLEPTDDKVINILISIYRNTDDKEKLSEMEKKRDSLK